MGLRTVAALIAIGMSVEEIADHLGYSEGDVRRLMDSEEFRFMAQALREKGERGADYFMADYLPLMGDEDNDDE